MQPNLSVNIGKLKLKNPVMVASGTFGYAEEFRHFLDLKELGAIVTKTITLNPRQGNRPPRTCETPSGMLNAIGLENPGINAFLREKLPALKKYKVPVIVSIASEDDPDEFIAMARKLDSINAVSAIELNISCPNIKNHRLRDEKQPLISQDPLTTYRLLTRVRKVTKKTLITKLSPNVTSIGDIAQACERGGSDAVSLINTLLGMSINIESRRPKLASVCGGLSGPAIKPIAVRMVWEAYNKIRLPIIGMGGIMNSSDAVEFIIAGATAVSLGTVNFVDPAAAVSIIKGIKEYCRCHNTGDIKELRGSIRIES